MAIRGGAATVRKIRVPANGTVAEHEAPVAAWAWSVLMLWIKVRADLKLGGDHLLPGTSSGNEWSKTQHYAAIGSILSGIGLTASGGAYRLRHTFALRQLKRGRSPSEVAAWLGVNEEAVLRYRRIVHGSVDVV
jgi:integrase